MGKYVIEMESGTHIFVLGPEGIVHIGEPDVVYETVDGMQIGDAVINAKPYNEPDIEQIRKEAYEKGFDDGRSKCSSREYCMNESYQQGLNDAWEAARKICANWCISDDDLALIFGKGKTIDDIMREFTATEAIEKIRQYEQEKEEKQHTWIFSKVNEPSVNTTLTCSKCGYTITIEPGDTQALNFCPKCGDNKRGE